MVAAATKQHSTDMYDVTIIMVANVLQGKFMYSINETYVHESDDAAAPSARLTMSVCSLMHILPITLAPLYRDTDTHGQPPRLHACPPHPL